MECNDVADLVKTNLKAILRIIYLFLTPSDFRTDKSIRKRRPAVTVVRIYPYTDFAIEIWGFYRRLTDTLRYRYTRCSRASGLWHPLVSMFTKSEEKWSLPGVVRCFWRVLVGKL